MITNNGNVDGADNDHDDAQVQRLQAAKAEKANFLPKLPQPQWWLFPPRKERLETVSSSSWSSLVSSWCPLSSSSSQKQLPVTVWTILVVETAERFAYFGFRAVLILYFTSALHFRERTAIALFAYTTMLAYASPLVGALLADGPWGRYQTIFHCGRFYVLGLVILTVGASVQGSDNRSTTGTEDNVDGESITTTTAAGGGVGSSSTGSQSQQLLLLYIQRILSFVGLFITCVGTGGIKPCVSAFGADQLPWKQKPKHKHIMQSQSQSQLQQSPHPLLHCEVVEEAETVYPRVEMLKSLPDGVVDDDEDDEEEEEDAIQQHFFALFYVAINVGATSSFALAPLVRKYWGFAATFGTSTFCMVLALTLFYGQRRHYVHASHASDGNNVVQYNSDGSRLRNTFRLCGYIVYHNVRAAMMRLSPSRRRQRRHEHHALATTEETKIETEIEFSEISPTPPLRVYTTTTKSKDDDSSSCMIQRGHIHDHDDRVNMNDSDETNAMNRISGMNNDDIIDGVIRKTTTNDGDNNDDFTEAAQALYVVLILLMLPIFWCLYDQQSSVWILQANRMNTGILQPEQLNLLNPVEIMILVPLFDRQLYPYLTARGWDVRPLTRVSGGMVCAALAFFASAWVEYAMEQYQRHSSSAADNNSSESKLLSVWWQLPQITILAVAEVLVSVTGLEFAYAQAPHHLKAFIMALYLSTTALGDLLGGILYSSLFASWNMVTVLITCGILMLANWLVFCCVRTWWDAHDASVLLQAVHVHRYNDRPCDYR